MAGLGEEVHERALGTDAVDNTTYCYWKRVCHWISCLHHCLYMATFFTTVDLNERVISLKTINLHRFTFRAAFRMVVEARRQIEEQPGFLEETVELDSRASIKIPINSQPTED